MLKIRLEDIRLERVEWEEYCALASWWEIPPGKVDEKRSFARIQEPFLAESYLALLQDFASSRYADAISFVNSRRPRNLGKWSNRWVNKLRPEELERVVSTVEDDSRRIGNLELKFKTDPKSSSWVIVKVAQLGDEVVGYWMSFGSKDGYMMQWDHMPPSYRWKVKALWVPEDYGNHTLAEKKL